MNRYQNDELGQFMKGFELGDDLDELLEYYPREEYPRMIHMILNRLWKENQEQEINFGGELGISSQEMLEKILSDHKKWEKENIE